MPIWYTIAKTLQSVCMATVGCDTLVTIEWQGSRQRLCYIRYTCTMLNSRIIRQNHRIQDWSAQPYIPALTLTYPQELLCLCVHVCMCVRACISVGNVPLHSAVYTVHTLCVSSYVEYIFYCYDPFYRLFQIL